MKLHPKETVRATFQSPLGRIIVAATPRGIAGVWFEGQKHMPDASKWREDPSNAFIVQAMAQLREYFEGTRTQFELPLDLQAGTPFQQSVWLQLAQIPCGTTTSYRAIGELLGKPQGARAVGAAVGRNPVSIVVPCHRVLGSSGALTGYAGGTQRKSALLKLERAI